MIDSIINKEGTLLIVHFSESVDKKEAEQCYELVSTLIPKTQPGFTVITDLGRLNHMDFDCAGPVGAIMDLCNQAKVARVCRVIPNPEVDIGYSILTKFHYDTALVKVQTFPSFFQAMKSLIQEEV